MRDTAFEMTPDALRDRIARQCRSAREPASSAWAAICDPRAKRPIRSPPEPGPEIPATRPQTLPFPPPLPRASGTRESSHSQHAGAPARPYKGATSPERPAGQKKGPRAS